MLKGSIKTLLATAVVAASISSGYAASREPTGRTEIGFVKIAGNLSLRRLVVHAPNPKGTVLFLHGFPETLFVWKDIATALGDDYEVHAFDWPGFGQSTRPPVETFAYAPKDYAGVLKSYIDKAGIDRTNLTIYATDIGALPALLLAIEEPGIAKNIIVGDFAPFNRPNYMFDTLQNLKTEPSASQTRDHMNKASAEILANSYRRGLSKDERFDLPSDVQEDMVDGWSHGGLTSADAFYHYYSNFTRDQNYLEENIDRLKTSIKVVWGEKDFYINREMGKEFATRIHAKLDILPGIGHYPHLQKPEQVVEDVRTSFR
jgi:pimeloyl-ACP methyl ester carboxylesterase